MANEKMLNIASIKKDDAKSFSQQKKITVKGSTVVIDKKFRTTDVSLMINELFKNMSELESLGIHLSEFDINNYAAFLLIKYFTSVDIPDDLKEQIAIFHMMINNDYFNPIVNAFDPEEFKKIDLAIHEMLDVIPDQVARLKEKLNEGVTIEESTSTVTSYPTTADWNGTVDTVETDEENPEVE